MQTCLETQRKANMKGFCLEVEGILASFIWHDKVARNLSHPIKGFIGITHAAYSTRVQTPSNSCSFMNRKGYILLSLR